MTALILPKPALNEGCFASICAFTDDALFDACGVRIAFTTRAGGVSEGAYDSLNFGSHVEDNLECVLQNRALLMQALAPGVFSAAGLEGALEQGMASAGEDGEVAGANFQALAAALYEVLVVPNQVHGDVSLYIDTPASVPSIQKDASEGADAVIVDTPGIGALLCFADCVPVIAVLPNGAFAVIHAGWRGVENEITAKTLVRMANGAQELIAGANIYIGPYIHAECFETSPEVHDLFTSKFGPSCSFDANHIDLGAALRVQLERIGAYPSRIADINQCSVCNNAQFFSFRAQDGVAGRHGAFAIRLVE